MVALRSSPSGPLRTTDSDSVENASDVPGGSLTSALNAIVSPQKHRRFDDFIGGKGAVSGSAEGFGQLKWQFIQAAFLSSIAHSAPIGANFVIGVYNLSQGSGSRCGFTLGVGPYGGVALAQIDYFYWRVTTTSTNGEQRVGLGTSNAVALGPNGLYFEVDRFLNANWRIVSRRNGVSSVITTGLVATADLIHDIIFRPGANGAWEAVMDGVVLGTVAAANLPVGRMQPFLQLAAAGGTANFAVDTFDMEYNQ